MQSLATITAAGTITRVEGDSCWVKLHQEGGCSTCGNGSCFSADRGEKLVKASMNGVSLKSGDVVHLHILRQSAELGIWVLYGIPIALLLLMLFTLHALGYTDGVAGIASLLVLIPYYLLVRLARPWLRTQCNITVSL